MSLHRVQQKDTGNLAQGLQDEDQRISWKVTMETTSLITLMLGVLLIAAAAWYAWHMHSRKALKDQFGPEYAQAIRKYGDESKAVSALGKRQQRLSKYTIRPLSAREAQQFESEWRDTQAHFVDDPRGAVSEADALVCRLMETRGYPMVDFDRRAEDLSVDHPHVVQNYRAAHDIAVADQRGKSSTEDLRKAFVCYRALFAYLLQTQTATPIREVHA
jgi:hypothetical protein